mgnify:FL=1
MLETEIPETKTESVILGSGKDAHYIDKKVETGEMIPNPDYVELENQAKEILAAELGKELDFEDPETTVLVENKMRAIKTQEFEDKYEEY